MGEIMSNDSRTIQEAGINAKVVTVSGVCVTIVDRLDGGWYRCRTPEGNWHEFHGTCKLKEVR